ncbi:MAG TPA: transketolase C-terminal domain-containing protein, partial [Ilumatobacter sp.]|nr:transketolase C-terminal domain-containing protein [Ilumatobacter sp.]
AELLADEHIEADVIDLRVLNPLDLTPILESVSRTGRLVVAEGDWATCGVAAEVVSQVIEELGPSALLAAPARVTLAAAPAPTSRALERLYYPSAVDVAAAARHACELEMGANR